MTLSIIGLALSLRMLGGSKGQYFAEDVRED
jgi:hypothetical protein